MSRAFKWFVAACVGLGGIMALGVMIWLYPSFKLGQSFSTRSLSHPIVITDRYGKEIHRIFGTENREWIGLDRMPDSLKLATIMAEDRRFYSHFGVDLVGIARAMRINFLSGGYRQGASTLTQQIARKAFLTDDKNVVRKLKEMAIAVGIETKLEKNEILEVYLNTVPYGPRINGVKLAARTYFSKNPIQLSIAESLVLASLPKDPIRLSRKKKVQSWFGSCGKEKGCSPFDSEDYQSSRIETLLLQIAEFEGWSPIKTQQVWAQLSRIKLADLQKNWTQDDFQHWQFYIRAFLEKQGMSLNNYPNGLIIKTTLDSSLQEQMYRFIRGGASAELFANFNAENLALILLDHQSRGPLVWIGSKYFWNEDISGQIDMIQARRQVGSSIKPFIYAAAIDNGYEPPTLISDTKIKFKKGQKQMLNNADGLFYGRMSMSRALNWSRNIPAVKAFYLAGGEKKVRQYLDQVYGLSIGDTLKNHNFGWTLALGTTPLRLMDLANGYATLVTSKKTKICPILELTDFLGKKIENPCNKDLPQFLDPKTSFFITEILSNPHKRPNAWGWRITPPKYPGVGVKTGTSSKRINGKLLPSDNVVAGFTPHASMMLWAGNTDGKPLNDGGLAVLSIGALWRDLMTMFLDKYPDKYERFSIPATMQKDLITYRGEWASREFKDKEFGEFYNEHIQDFGAWVSNPKYRYTPKAQKEKVVAVPEKTESVILIEKEEENRAQEVIQVFPQKVKIDRERVRQRVLKNIKRKVW